MKLPAGHPLLSPEAVRDLEQRLFGGDEAREWPAMVRAADGLAAAIERDAAEVGGLGRPGRWLVVAGKGHNGGDALLTAARLAARHPAARIEVCAPFGSRSLRPLALRAWRELWDGPGRQGDRLRQVDQPEGRYDLLVDGLFGFQFRPPVAPALFALIERLNALPVGFRAAVDLPSAGLLRADFTYATGVVKTHVLGATVAGRVRYLDLGFFRDGVETVPEAAEHVLLPDVLLPLAGLREAGADKRSFGHVLVVGGSAAYPGAVLLSVLAALRSGVGLVTAFVPEPLVPAFAARAPEAMWVGFPLNAEGGLASVGEALFRDRENRATAIVLGPGLGRGSDTLALARAIVHRAVVPLVIDADALQPEILAAGRAPRILTPHAGELARIGGRSRMGPGVVLVEKGPATRIVAEGRVHHALVGGPVLARGGSGDLLAGLIGGLLAREPLEPVLAAARGVLWHGLAADSLARARGAEAVCTSQVLEHLPEVLRGIRG